MIGIYVNKKPNESEECPFYSTNNKKCNITNEKCCLKKGNLPCEHLVVLEFGFEEMGEE